MVGDALRTPTERNYLNRAERLERGKLYDEETTAAAV